MNTPPTHRLVAGIVAMMAMPSLVLAGKKPPAADSQRSPREGGAYGLGGIWFDRERAPEPAETEAPADDAASAKETLDETGEDNWMSLDLAWNLTSMGLYETKPARHASDRPDWHWDTELAPELEWAAADDFSLTAATGMRISRYAVDPDLDTDEPFAALQATWRVTDHWLATLRHESFWDFTPGFEEKQFAAHTTDLRVQYDTTDPAKPVPVRWQSYAEIAHSFADPSLHDWFGAATGAGCAIRIVPQTLRLQTGAGVSYQIYPNYGIGPGHHRRGWNIHTTTALVWTPGDHTSVSFGIDWMHSAENDAEFRFDNISVPLSVSWSW